MREGEEKGRSESKMNGCGTNAHLIYLLSSVSHSQCAPPLYWYTTNPLSVTYISVYAHRLNWCVVDPNLCVCIAC